MSETSASTALLAALWRDAGLDPADLVDVELTAPAPLFPSSFRVGLAAQLAAAAAGAAAREIHRARGAARQSVRADLNAVEAECSGFFSIDGHTPDIWEKFSGLYPVADGHVRIHANFEHHRDGVLELLGLGPAGTVEREDVAARLAGWGSEAFETAANARGLVVSAVRSFAQWDRHPQSAVTRATPVIDLRRIGDARPRSWPAAAPEPRPLDGLRVLDLTRILAGPVCGRTLAAHGADVMLVNGPHLPNIPAIVDTSRGKRSVLLDLRSEDGRARLRALAADARVFVQGYRPGGLAALGFDPETLARSSPGIVCVSLSAYAPGGPWSDRRGFDSLVQTATGFNHAEAEALGSEALGTEAPRPMPFQILDYASGFLMAFGAQAALLRQSREGGSWQVGVSLQRTADWLRSLGRDPAGPGRSRPDTLAPWLARWPCDRGELVAPGHGVSLGGVPASWSRPSVSPGTHEPAW